MSESSLSNEELLRYSRHLLLPEVDVAGQLRIKNASVLIVGAGGLGSPVLLYLAAAGVGKIGVVDFDRVDESNLQRQVIYTSDDVSKSKIEQTTMRAFCWVRQMSMAPSIALKDKLVSFVSKMGHVIVVYFQIRRRLMPCRIVLKQECLE